MSHKSLYFCSLLLCVVLAVVKTAPAQGTGTVEATAQQSDEKTEAKAAKSVVPILFLNNAVLEAPQADDPFMGTQGSEPLKDIVARLEKARDDDNVSALVVHMGSAAIGAAQVEELHKAIRDVRDAGKPVYAFADSMSFGSLALLSAASRISVAPVGDLFINGMHGEQLYLRGLLRKIHVTPDYLTCGAYKSAGEIFMRSGPSPEAEEMMNWLFDGLFDSFVDMIAEGRGIPREKVLELVDHGLYSAEKATELGIIDACEYRQDMLDTIQGEHGEHVTLSKKYGKDKKGTVDFSNPFWLLKVWAEALAGAGESGSDDPAVAIVYVEGVIVPGSPQPSPFGSQGVAYSNPIRLALDQAAADDSVKAVVLRVNSPGGSAVASEIILEATRRVAAKKPFVVSMGDVAGSGGYYVACGTDTIFADAATITASIGVVAGKLATHEMWDSWGIHWHPIERGKNAGIFSSANVFTDHQRETLQTWMDEVYEDFKGHVVQARGDRLKKPIDELAGGRVFTGKQALELGLVDKLGTLSDAIKFAAQLADISDYDVRVIPRPKNFVELMFKDLAGKSKDDDKISLGTAGPWQTQPIWKAAMPLLDRLQPRRAAALRRTLIQLEVMQRESISLMTPDFVFGISRWRAYRFNAANTPSRRC